VNARVKWFKIGDHLQLHLVEGLKTPMNLPIMFHISLSVTSVDNFITELKKRSIPYYNGYGEPNKMNLRGDGVKQVLFKDPDGYWLEVNDTVH
jgi:lactoylglutathione lyase